MESDASRAARAFVSREGRLLERRMMATLFEGAGPAGVYDALAGYRNSDGGFGHGLEPDTRAPDSQPLAVEVAFASMEAIGRPERDFVVAACDFLSAIGPGVGCLTASALEAPKAPHWAEFALEPSINPTAGLAAFLWRWEVAHPWRDKATSYCWAELERGVPGEAHGFGEVLSFLDAVGDQGRAGTLADRLADRLANLEPFHLDPAAPGYGLTPLHYVPTPESRWRCLFDDATLDGHLDALAASQEEDGGFPISWETIGPAAVQEWRGIETLRALRVLHAFGRW